MLCRSHGLEKRGSYNHIIPGNNFRMSNISAAFGCGQLDYYPYLVERKLHIQTKYFEIIEQILQNSYPRSKKLLLSGLYLLELHQRYLSILGTKLCLYLKNMV